MDILSDVKSLLQARDPGQPEFHQAVEEVVESVAPVLERHVITSYSIHYTKLYDSG